MPLEPMSGAGHVYGGSVVAPWVNLVWDEPHRRLADDGAGEQPVAFGGDLRVVDRLVDRSFGRRASGAATVERAGRRDRCQDKYGVRYSGADAGVRAFLTRALAIDEGTAQQSEILRCLTNVQDRVIWVVSLLAREG
jgi:hypothetical protein